MVQYSVSSSLDSQPQVHSTTTNETSSLLTGLQPLEEYTVQVSAHTSEGAGPLSFPITNQTSESVNAEDGACKKKYKWNDTAKTDYAISYTML